MINVSVTGNIGADPELKDVEDTQVLSFSVASNQKIKGKKKTTWVRCSIWGARAEALQEYLAKGDKVCVVGSLDVREYENNDGDTVTSLDLRVDQLDFMSGPKADADEPEAKKTNKKETLDKSKSRNGSTPSKRSARDRDEDQGDLARG